MEYISRLELYVECIPMTILCEFIAPLGYCIVRLLRLWVFSCMVFSYGFALQLRSQALLFVIEGESCTIIINGMNVTQLAVHRTDCIGVLMIVVIIGRSRSS